MILKIYDLLLWNYKLLLYFKIISPQVMALTKSFFLETSHLSR
jgi:hypothetical protein